MSEWVEEREFAIRHYACDKCGFTAKHKTWQTGSLTLKEAIRALEDTAKLFLEHGDVFIEDSQGRWAFCRTEITDNLYYWVFRLLTAKDPCDEDFMREIST